ncbi:MAG: hypothetical protein KDD84_01840, partial [Caldilineaceae bacterium]|nr:hypothetical protein [Caldilineaceae bacterium]
MNLSGLLPLLRQLPAFMQLLDEGGSADNAEPLALLEAARPFVAAGLAIQRQAPLVIVTTNVEQAQRWIERLPNFLPPPEDGGPAPLFFADPDALPYERIFWSDRTRQQRLTALAALQSRSGPPPIVVTSVAGLMQKTLPAKELRLSLRSLNVGSFVRLDELTERWAQNGYNPVEVVEEPGTFARRGGIVDIWPPNLPHPVRIDLFGDEVDSLRVFDPATQRSERRVDRIEIGPGSEALSKYGPKALERLAHGDGRVPSHVAVSPVDNTLLNDPNLLLAVREEIRQEADALSDSRSFRGIEWYMPYIYSQPASLLDHLPDSAILIVDDGAAVFTAIQETERRTEQTHAELLRTGEVPEGFVGGFFGADEISKQLRARRPLVLGFGDMTGRAESADTPLARAFVPGPTFGGETKRLVREVQKHIKAGQGVVLVTRQAARLQEELTEAEIPVHLQAELAQPPASGVTLLQGIAGDGFVLRGDDNTLHLYTDVELFGWRKSAARKSRRAQSTVAPELFFADVKSGDYVVHMEHGIGQYEGLIRLVLGG